MRNLIFLLAILLSLYIACGQGDPKGSAVSPDPIAQGAAVFQRYCVVCHGKDGKLGLNGAKDLTQTQLSLEERITQIAKGKNLMTPFEGILSPAEIDAVAKYTLTLKK